MQHGETALLVHPAVDGTEPGRLAFDYSGLPADDADLLRGAADQIRSWQKLTASFIIKAGRNLIGAKKMLGHGRFGAWIAAEFAWDERTAQRFMQAAEVFGKKADIVSGLAATTIYQLSAPSTPEPVRVAVVDRLEQGEPVTHDEIKSLIRRGKANARAEREDAKRSPEERAKRKRAEERRARDLAKYQAERETEVARQLSARREAAALIVQHLGDDAARIADLLDNARGIFGADIRDVINPPHLTARLAAMRG